MQQIHLPINPIPAQHAQLKNRLSSRWLVPLAVGVVLTLWASSFAGIAIGLEGYSPAQLAFLRYLVASIALLANALLTRMPLPHWRDWPGIFVLGAIGFSLYNVALNAGQQTVSAGVAGFIISAEIGVIAVLAAVFFKERLSRVGWFGVLISLMGVALISFAGETEVHVSGGALLVMVATGCIGLYSILQKSYLKKYSALQFTTYAIWAGTLCLLPAAPDAFQSLSSAPTSATLAVIYMGLFPGAVGYVSWSYVLAHIPAARAGSYLTIIPVIALVIAWLWLGEIPTLVAIVGGAIVLLGVILINRAR